jgi:hypothetical protein
MGLPTLDRMGVLNKEKTSVRDNFASTVEQFLNRIMVLPVESQNRIFELFYERYGIALEAAKRQSAFDFGVEEIRAKNLHRVNDPETLFTDPASGARTMLHELEGEVDVLRHPFSAAEQNAKRGFYQNLRSGRIYAVSDHWDAYTNEVLLMAVKGPRRGLEMREFEGKYEIVDQKIAEEWWEREYANTPATEARRFHLLSGAIFPIYDKIMGASGIQNVKIARAQLIDGQSLVGLSLSSTDVPNVKQRLGIGTPLADASTQEVHAMLWGGSVIELDNGWRLTTSTISGDEVVELVLNGVPANRKELLRYGFSEEILAFKRRWFVLPDNAMEILTALFRHRKPVKDQSSVDA